MVAFSKTVELYSLQEGRKEGKEMTANVRNDGADVNDAALIDLRCVVVAAGKSKE